jgi:hypothetical protein
MFDHGDAVFGLWPGEGPVERAERLAWEDDLTAEIACQTEAEGDVRVEEDRHFLPSGLEEILPGPFLAAIVSSVDPARLNGHDAVRLMQAQARLGSHHEAGILAAVAEVAYSLPGNPDSAVERCFEAVEFAEVEVAAGLRLTRRAARKLVDQALGLKHRLSRVWQALSNGLIDQPRMRVLYDILGHLPSETVDTVLDQVVGEAGELTTGQLRHRVDKLVLEADPDGSASSFVEGLADRKLTTYPNPDRTASLLISNGRPDDVAAAGVHVDKLARSLKTEGEERTLDQLRADVALDLLRGKCVHGTNTPGTVNITVPGETLAGLGDEPGEMAGFGPVFAEIARKTVRENTDGEWRFVVTDNGQPVATGTLVRRPSPALQRQVNALYPKCVHPGCRQDAWDCDLDHRTQRQNGGATCIHNLAPLCRFHHRVKDTGGWQLQRNQNGDHQWTSPLCHTYTQRRGPP